MSFHVLNLDVPLSCKMLTDVCMNSLFTELYCLTWASDGDRKSRKWMFACIYIVKTQPFGCHSVRSIQPAFLLAEVKVGERLSGKVTNIWKDRVWVDVGLQKDASQLVEGRDTADPFRPAASV